MNKFDLDSYAPGKHQPDRSAILMKEVFSEYDYLKHQLKADQTINLACMVGGVAYDVYQVAASNDIVSVGTQVEGHVIRLKCPIEQISFSITVSPKTSPEPPREIGFKATP